MHKKNTLMLTRSEENYLKTILHLSEETQKPVSTNAVADKLSTKAASATDMIQKLAAKGLASYYKYKGVKLTTKGTREALRVVRKHRLWEVFLLKELHFKWDEVHEIAEQLEHIKSPLLIERLDEHLGFPKFDPHGDPIPNANGEVVTIPTTTLSILNPGERCRVICAKDSSSDLLTYLDKIDISLGVEIEIMEFHAFDSSFSIRVEGAGPITLSSKVAENIIIERL